MPTAGVSSPKFCKNQSVCFVGGDGIVRRCSRESGIWIYLVEMPLGLDPDFGRVGDETMVLLSEADLWE